MVVASYHDLLYQKKNSSISPTFLDWRTDIILHLAYFITCTTDHIYIYIYICKKIPMHSYSLLRSNVPLAPVPSVAFQPMRLHNRIGFDLRFGADMPWGSVLGWFVKHEAFTIFHNQKRGNMWHFPRETWDFHHFCFPTFDFKIRFGLKKKDEFTWSNLVAFAWGVPFFHRYQGLPWSALDNARLFPPPISRNAQGALGRDKIRNETPAVAMVRSQKLTQWHIFPNSRSMSNHFRETSSKISI